MEITIADGKHSYDFEYTLAEVPANQGFTLDSPGFSRPLVSHNSA
jgi:hypothetical protein